MKKYHVADKVKGGWSSETYTMEELVYKFQGEEITVLPVLPDGSYEDYFSFVPGENEAPQAEDDQDDFNPATAGMFACAKHLYMTGWRTWKGRASRKEYWLGYLGISICQIPYYVALFATMNFDALEYSSNPFAGYTPATWALWVIWFLTCGIPGYGATVRRLHDSGKSGWWALLFPLSVIPFVGTIAAIVAIIFMVLPSQPGRNQYGRNPYARIQPRR